MKIDMRNRHGFTLIELLVVMGLVTVIFTISTISLANIEKDSQLEALLAAIKMSIAKAQSETINGNPAGVYFETNRYVFFYGDQFTEGNPQNEITDLPDGVIFSVINLPLKTLNFLKISGYVKNYLSPENFTLLDQGTGKSHQVIINKLGLLEVE